ncbi:hypothetical protein ACTXT7_009835 [Hymenolepis weldensis]
MIKSPKCNHIQAKLKLIRCPKRSALICHNRYHYQQPLPGHGHPSVLESRLPDRHSGHFKDPGKDSRWNQRHLQGGVR